MRIVDFIQISGVIVAVAMFAIIICLALGYPGPLKKMAEEKLSQEIGQPVSISGGVKFFILPRPMLDVHDVTVGGDDRGTISVGHLLAQIELGPLFVGKVVGIEILLDQLRVVVADNQWPLVLGDGKTLVTNEEENRTSASSQEVVSGLLRSVKHIEIRDAQYRYFATDRTLPLEGHFNAQVSASGPLRPLNIEADLQAMPGQLRLDMTLDDLGGLFAFEEQALKITMQHRQDVLTLNSKVTWQDILRIRGQFSAERVTLSAWQALADSLSAPQKASVPQKAEAAQELTVEAAVKNGTKPKSVKPVQGDGSAEREQQQQQQQRQDQDQKSTAPTPDNARPDIDTGDVESVTTAAIPFPSLPMNVDIDLDWDVGTFEMASMKMTDLSGHLRLAQGQLSIDPFKLSWLGGAFTGGVGLYSAENKGHYSKIEGRDIQLSQVDDFLGGREWEGALKLQADLKAAGDNHVDVLSSLAGRVEAKTDAAILDTYYLEVLAADLFAALFADKDRTVSKVKCFDAKADIEQGVASLSSLVLDTQKLIVTGKGKVDIARQKLDLKLNPKPKNPSLISIAPKINISGDFRAPKISPDSLDVLTSVATTVGAGALGPVGYLLTVAKTGSLGKSDCAKRLRQEMEEEAAKVPATSATTLPQDDKTANENMQK
ncbi:MAG: hypothetical protein CMF31_08145 [Kordiimonas sp.]|nr:hypothetical protein [Kordiimonas sp.]|tara:strand:+ start:2490 stop:4466 length:1977 start_codon:yes stop_codon:yes gene_type:complete